MSIFGDDLPQSNAVKPSPGEDLYGLSVAELAARIEIYQAEIVRLEGEAVKKETEAKAAHAFFGENT